MRLHPLVLVLAGGFAAAAAVGVLFVVGGPGRGLPLDLVPLDSTVVIESGEFQTLEKVIAALDASGNDRMSLIPHPLAKRLVSLRALLEEGTLLIATVPSASSPEPGALILFRAKSVGKLDLAVKGIQAWLGGGARQWLTAEYRGHPYEFSAPSVQPDIVSMGRRRGDLILATSVDLLRRAFDIADQREPSITTSGIVRALQREASSHHALRVIVPAWSSSTQTDSPPAARTKAILGIRTLSGIAVSVQASEDGFTESAEIVYRESRNGLAAAMAGLPPSAIDLAAAGRFLPADLPLHAILSVPDLASIWEHLPHVAAAAGIADEEGLRQRLKGLDQVLDVDLRREYLGALGSRVVLGVEEVNPLPRGASNRRGTTLSAVAAIEVSRPAALKRILARAQGMARLFGGIPQESGDAPSFVSWRIPGMEPLEPSFLLEEKYLAVATSPGLIISGVAGGAKSLASRTDLAARKRDLPSRSHCLAFLRLGSFQGSALGPFLELAPSGAQGSLAIGATFHRHRLSVEARAPFPFILRALGRIMAEPGATRARSGPVDTAVDQMIATEVAPD